MCRKLPWRGDWRISSRLGELPGQRGLNYLARKGAKPEQGGHRCGKAHDGRFKSGMAWASVEDRGPNVAEFCLDMGCGRRAEPARAICTWRRDGKLRFGQ